jgi:hypothetical protein
VRLFAGMKSVYFTIFRLDLCISAMSRSVGPTPTYLPQAPRKRLF